MLLKTVAEYDGIYIACHAVDFRKNVDGLAHIVKRDFKLCPFANYLFLFTNKSRDKIKGLSWDKNGFAMYYKRLDGKGGKFKWPKSPNAAREISAEQLRLLMSGLSVEPPRGFGDVSARDF